MNKVVFITGASRGIGYIIGSSLVKSGYRVYGTSRSARDNGVFPLVSMEIGDGESVRDAVSGVLSVEGRIDVLVNNAGYDLYASVMGTSDVELRNQMEVNFFGSVSVTHEVLPGMIERGSGRIINISSIGGLMALPFNSAYSASKFAMEGYFESLGYEVQQHGIRVSSIQPQSVKTGTLDTSILQANTENPLFLNQVTRLVDKMRSGGDSSGLDPETIAKTVERILMSKNPKANYPIGGLSRYMPKLKRLFPRLFSSIITRQFISE